MGVVQWDSRGQVSETGGGTGGQGDRRRGDRGTFQGEYSAMFIASKRVLLKARTVLYPQT